MFTPSVAPLPISTASDLKLASSSEWHWITVPAFSVTASPMVTRVFSGITAPSSNSRRPTRTPASRHSIPLTGVPSNTGRKLIRLSFHIRSCRQ